MANTYHYYSTEAFEQWQGLNILKKANKIVSTAIRRNKGYGQVVEVSTMNFLIFFNLRSKSKTCFDFAKLQKDGYLETTIKGFFNDIKNGRPLPVKEIDFKIKDVFTSTVAVKLAEEKDWNEIFMTARKLREEKAFNNSKYTEDEKDYAEAFLNKVLSMSNHFDYVKEDEIVPSVYLEKRLADSLKEETKKELDAYYQKHYGDIHKGFAALEAIDVFHKECLNDCFTFLKSSGNDPKRTHQAKLLKLLKVQKAIMSANSLESVTDNQLEQIYADKDIVRKQVEQQISNLVDTGVEADLETTHDCGCQKDTEEENTFKVQLSKESLTIENGVVWLGYNNAHSETFALESYIEKQLNKINQGEKISWYKMSKPAYQYPQFKVNKDKMVYLHNLALDTLHKRVQRSSLEEYDTLSNRPTVVFLKNILKLTRNFI